MSFKEWSSAQNAAAKDKADGKAPLSPAVAKPGGGPVKAPVNAKATPKS